MSQYRQNINKEKQNRRKIFAQWLANKTWILNNIDDEGYLRLNDFCTSIDNENNREMKVSRPTSVYLDEYLLFAFFVVELIFRKLPFILRKN